MQLRTVARCVSHGNSIKLVILMANVWVCSSCFVFTAVTIRSLVRHITVAHASKPNFKIKCVIPGCLTEYTKINSLRTHLRRRHKQICVDNPVKDHQSEDNHINEDQGNMTHQVQKTKIAIRVWYVFY